MMGGKWLIISIAAVLPAGCIDAQRPANVTDADWRQCRQQAYDHAKTDSAAFATLIFPPYAFIAEMQATPGSYAGLTRSIDVCLVDKGY